MLKVSNRAGGTTPSDVSQIVKCVYAMFGFVLAERAHHSDFESIGLVTDRVILDEAPEISLNSESGDDDQGTGDVALMSPSKMETLGKDHRRSKPSPAHWSPARNTAHRFPLGRHDEILDQATRVNQGSFIDP